MPETVDGTLAHIAALLENPHPGVRRAAAAAIAQIAGLDPRPEDPALVDDARRWTAARTSRAPDASVA